MELEGIFGLAANPIPGFAAHAVDYSRPFLSETGYRSFLGYHFAPAAGTAPDAYAREIITDHISRALKGKLRTIEPRFRQRHQQPE